MSPACDHCYAQAFSHRLGRDIWGKDADRRFFEIRGDHWREPIKWNKKAAKLGRQLRVFCGSMCDVMEDRGDLNIWRAPLYELIDLTPSLDWLLLTKRPQNFRRFLPPSWLEKPRANVIGMTTIENEDYLWRVSALIDTPFVRRGLSMEPLLGHVDLTRIETRTGVQNALERNQNGSRIDWIITGGESGHGARKTQPEWIQSLRDQALSHSVAFHHKQWGEWCHTDQMSDDAHRIIDDGYNDPGLYKIGKKAAGSLLDGQEWKQFPGRGERVSTYVDCRGNSFQPTPPQLRLLKNGWQMTRKEKRGGFTMIHWRNPDTCEIWPQSTALEIEKLRSITRRQMRELTEVSA